MIALALSTLADIGTGILSTGMAHALPVLQFARHAGEGQPANG